MTRTGWLRETRMRRFEEAFGIWTEKRLTQEEAAALPGVSTHVPALRRPVPRGRAGRAGGQRIGQVSSRRAPADGVLLRGQRPADKGSTGDAAKNGAALNVCSFQLPKTCSFRLPLTTRDGRHEGTFLLCTKGDISALR